MFQMVPLRTLIVDDSSEFLERLERWLRSRPEFEIVGRADSGLEAVQLTKALNPDLVVMDVAMPLMNGYEATERMKEGGLGPTVILMSLLPQGDVVAECDPTADAFLDKDVLYKELLPTVARLFPEQREHPESIL